MDGDTVTAEEFARVEQKLDKILDAIYGNGKPGLATRLALIEQWQIAVDKRFIDHVSNEVKKDEGWKEWLKPAIQSLITAGVIGLIYLFVMHFPNGIP